MTAAAVFWVAVAAMAIGYAVGYGTAAVGRPKPAKTPGQVFEPILAGAMFPKHPAFPGVESFDVPPPIPYDGTDGQADDYDQTSSVADRALDALMDDRERCKRSDCPRRAAVLVAYQTPRHRAYRWMCDEHGAQLADSARKLDWPVVVTPLGGDR